MDYFLTLLENKKGTLALSKAKGAKLISFNARG